ncbi:MAG: DUF3500 domain-containing protein [Polaribacter sp.]|uniref:DUF3500 domain-containing protein n=1 Tax=Algibacter sp. TaxID=1872428 RepID=UPI00262C3536|nr:DUF3500 domain-containing protein [Algibacter sp.]MDG1730949.1 DUF3500 domain-containing protein [Algibacter sp.]MDG2356736.1 DUF3500 domain-containing protein [Polaribacter sp.]
MKSIANKIIAFICTVFIVSLNSCSSSENSTNTGGVTNVEDCTTAGTVAQSTETQIETMRQAMLTFRNSLSSTLLSQASNCLEDDRFYLWHNTPSRNNRDGIYYGDLSSTQLANFKSLLQLFLSSEGYQKVNEITVLAEGFLSTINSNQWNPNYYSIDMFGDPENTGSWGFQLDGHHCVINFLVHGDNISMVPAFLGGEPVRETYNGTTFDIFQDERDLALNLYNGFTTAENTAAVSSGSSATMLVGPANQNGQVDPFRGTYDYSGFETGLKYSEMSASTQANLILVMQEYVYNLNTTFADQWWADIMTNIDDTYFVWLDNVTTPTDTTQFYYRIYNPYLWVEYNMENPVGQGLEQWNHAHTITRIPNNPATDNGGDYGIFAQMINQDGPKTIYEHYAMADHHKASEFTFDYKVVTPHIHNNDGHSHTHNHKG